MSKLDFLAMSSGIEEDFSTLDGFKVGVSHPIEPFAFGSTQNGCYLSRLKQYTAFRFTSTSNHI